MKKISVKFIKYLISILLLFYVIHSSEILTPDGFTNLVIVIKDSNIRFLALSVLFIFFIEIINSFKWFCLSKALTRKNSYFLLLKYCFIGRFFNLLLPSNVGGDLIRIRLQGKVIGSYADSAAIVFVERLTGLITLLILAAWVSFFYAGDMGIPYIEFALIITLISLFFAVICVFDSRFINYALGIENKKLFFLKNVAEKLNRFRNAVLRFRQKPKALVISFLNSVIFYFFAILNGWVAVKVFEANVSFLDMMVAIPLIMILMNLPISIGGIGLMEFSYMLLLGFFAISPSVALSVVLLFRAKTFIAAGIGYIFSVIDLSLDKSSIVGETRNVKI